MKRFHIKDIVRRGKYWRFCALAAAIVFAAAGASAQTSDNLIFDFTKVSKKVETANPQYYVKMEKEEILQAFRDATPEGYEGVVFDVEDTDDVYWEYDDKTNQYRPMNIQTSPGEGGKRNPGRLKIIFNTAKALRVRMVNMELYYHKQYPYTLIYNGNQKFEDKSDNSGFTQVSLNTPQILKDLEIIISIPTNGDNFCIEKMYLLNANKGGAKEDITKWEVPTTSIVGNATEETELPLVTAVPEEGAIFAEYTSSDPETFTVEDGKLKFRKAGEATLGVSMAENHVFNHSNIVSASIPVKVNDVTNGIDEISTESGPAEYFDLHGRRISVPTTPGIYIERRGNKTSKIAIH